jgi:hypothetical protein
MTAHVVPAVHASDLIGSVAGAIVFILIMSLVREPTRQRFSAVFVAGAGSAYLGGGLGLWEFVLPVAVTACAYRGLTAYRFIGLAWLLHAGWDVLHHYHGNPLLGFMPASSAGCALTDAIWAAWFLARAPSVWDLLRRQPAVVSPG